MKYMYLEPDSYIVGRHGGRVDAVDHLICASNIVAVDPGTLTPATNLAILLLCRNRRNMSRYY